MFFGNKSYSLFYNVVNTTTTSFLSLVQSLSSSQFCTAVTVSSISGMPGGIGFEWEKQSIRQTVKVSIESCPKWVTELSSDMCDILRIDSAIKARLRYLVDYQVKRRDFNPSIWQNVSRPNDGFTRLIPLCLYFFSTVRMFKAFVGCSKDVWAGMLTNP